MSGSDLDQKAAASLGSLARDGMAADAFDEAGERVRLLDRAERESSPLRFLSVRFLAAPAFAVAVALVVWSILPGKLRYQVEGVRASGSYVSAPLDRSAFVRFSDDSRIEVSKGSQIRVEGTSRSGARVLLERGSASVHVAHRQQTDWTFAAGPCEVLVTGTRFDLKWDPASEVLELRLREGSVEIQTPLSPARLPLRAGQEVRVDLRRSTTMTAETSADTALRTDDASATARRAPVAAPAAPEAALMDAPSAPSSAKISWSKLVAGGEFKAVLAQAEARGIPGCLAGCAAHDLSALADAARYSGRTELAEQSLQALRTRFAGDSAGHAAAFLLGRLREARGSASEARTWYDRYLAESPNGSYASEALAGKMRTTLSASGPAAAEPIALEYLRRYPTGVHAGTARGILGSR